MFHNLCLVVEANHRDVTVLSVTFLPCVWQDRSLRSVHGTTELQKVHVRIGVLWFELPTGVLLNCQFLKGDVVSTENLVPCSLLLLLLLLLMLLLLLLLFVVGGGGVLVGVVSCC